MEEDLAFFRNRLAKNEFMATRINNKIESYRSIDFDIQEGCQNSYKHMKDEINDLKSLLIDTYDHFRERDQMVTDIINFHKKFDNKISDPNISELWDTFVCASKIVGE